MPLFSWVTVVPLKLAVKCFSNDIGPVWRCLAVYTVLGDKKVVAISSPAVIVYVQSVTLAGTPSLEWEGTIILSLRLFQQQDCITFSFCLVYVANKLQVTGRL